jgi:hypothetical protein
MKTRRTATTIARLLLPALLLGLAGCAGLPRSDRDLARLGFSGDRSAELFERIGAEPTNARLH